MTASVGSMEPMEAFVTFQESTCVPGIKLAVMG